MNKQEGINVITKDDLEDQPAQAVAGKPLSEEEIQEHFDKADKLFDGKEFEDGAVVTNRCLHCGGENGHHYMNCSGKDEEIGGGLREPARVEGSSEPGAPYEEGQTYPEPAQTEEEALDRLPPTIEELVAAMEPTTLHEFVAKVCHEVNRVYCAEHGDFSHAPWGDLPDGLRESIVKGVAYRWNNPGATAADMHDAWVDYKKAQGYTFGNMKDHEAKTHPNMIPYHQLHRDERCKDVIFLTICDVFFGRDA